MKLTINEFLPLLAVLIFVLDGAVATGIVDAVVGVWLGHWFRRLTCRKSTTWPEFAVVRSWATILSPTLDANTPTGYIKLKQEGVTLSSFYARRSSNLFEHFLWSCCEEISHIIMLRHVFGRHVAQFRARQKIAEIKQCIFRKKNWRKLDGCFKSWMRKWSLERFRTNYNSSLTIFIHD